MRNILKHLTKQQLLGLGFLILLLLSLPVALFVTKQLQEIRPRASIAGAANFHLTEVVPAGGTAGGPYKVGDTISVLASLELTTPGLRVSGVDYRVLYDKTKLQFQSVAVPALGDGQPFTDKIAEEDDKPFDDKFNYTRMVFVTRRNNAGLVGGTIPLGTFSFKALVNGPAVVKFPEDNVDSNGVDIMQVVGIDLGSGGVTPTATPTITGGPTETPGPSPTVTSGAATLTPSPTDIPNVPTETPTVTPVEPSVTPTPTESSTLQNGLVSWWRMNETSGNSVNDFQGNHDGVATGTTIVDGITLKARQFNGTSDYISVPIVANLKPSSVSVVLWFKSTQKGGYLLSVAGVSEYKGYTIRSASTGSAIRFILGIPGANNSIIVESDPSISLFDGKWHLVVGTYDRVTAVLYIDNKTPITKSATQAIDYRMGNLYFGSLAGQSNFFKGTIDQVRIYNRALSADEVATLFAIKR